MPLQIGNLETDPLASEVYFVDVIVPLPLPGLFTYRVAADMSENLIIGGRVLVEFGASKIYTALLVRIHQQAPKFQAKYILELLDTVPVIKPLQLDFFDWMAAYYMSTVGEVYQAALPSGLKMSSESSISLHPDYPITHNHTFGKTAQKLLDILQNQESISFKDAQTMIGTSLYAAIKQLSQQKAIIVYQQIKEKYVPAIKRWLRLKTDNNSSETLSESAQKQLVLLEKNAKQQLLLLRYLQIIPLNQLAEKNEKGIEKKVFLDNENLSESSYKTLLKNGIFEEFEQRVWRIGGESGLETQSLPSLSSSQQLAYGQILDNFETKDIALLHGITGSGKTEVYIHLLHQALENGGQALMMLPEIALTTQIVERLQRVFGAKLGVYHSKFSDNERVEAWERVLNGQFSLIIGVRSSVFLPFQNLSLVIIDEEHESSYKQQEPSPRYNGRDSALMLARLHGAKALLGSATPSIEAYYMATNNKWGLIEMNERYSQTPLPKIECIDLNKARASKQMQGDFSSELLVAIEQAANLKQQTILFQNRRGYAPYMSCQACAHVPKCANCDVSLTLHQYSQELRCHYCGHIERVPKSCPACGAPQLRTVGFGTEKIEEELPLLLPGIRVARLDQDTTRKSGSMGRILTDFENQKTEVLVGTQMISKGLDFSHVQLVGVFDTDRMMHYPDFRSYERTFQLITQVSGRSGRRDIQGLVLIQTTNPAHPVFSWIISNDYKSFYANEINERLEYHYPPFVRLIKIVVRHAEQKLARQVAVFYAKEARAFLGEGRVLGPEAPVVERIKNMYHQTIIIKLEKQGLQIENIKKELTGLIYHTLKQRSFKDARIVADVDPC